MAFDALPSDPIAPRAAALSPAALIDAAAAPDRVWARENPGRLLAFLFVAPQDCDAIDELMSA